MIDINRINQVLPACGNGGSQRIGSADIENVNRSADHFTGCICLQYDFIRCKIGSSGGVVSRVADQLPVVIEEQKKTS